MIEAGCSLNSFVRVSTETDARRALRRCSVGEDVNASWIWFWVKSEGTKTSEGRRSLFVCLSVVTP